MGNLRWPKVNFAGSTEWPVQEREQPRLAAPPRLRGPFKTCPLFKYYPADTCKIGAKPYRSQRQYCIRGITPGNPVDLDK